MTEQLSLSHALTKLNNIYLWVIYRLLNGKKKKKRPGFKFSIRTIMESWELLFLIFI